VTPAAHGSGLAEAVGGGTSGSQADGELNGMDFAWSDEAAGDNVKVTVNGTDEDGEPTHNEWTGKFDGKDYAVTGDPTSDMRAYKKVDAHTLRITMKKDGKVTMTGKIVVSADGKSRTVTVSGTSPEVKTKAVYDKQ
jgi:hypothetical protein